MPWPWTQLGFGREHIAHLRFVRMYIPFSNSNGIYYNPFMGLLKVQPQLLARTTINNFKQPLKTEFKKNSHILMGSEIFLSEISSQIQINFKSKYTLI